MDHNTSSTTLFIYDPRISPGIRTFQESLYKHLSQINGNLVLGYFEENEFVRKITHKFKIPLPNLVVKKRGLLSIAKLLLLDFLLGSRFDTVLYTSQHGPVIRPGKHRNLLVIHDIIPLFYGSKLKRIYYQKVLPRIIGNIDIAIVISEKTRQDVSSIIALRDAQKITLIRSGMEHQSRSKSIHRAPIVLAIYRKEAWKNSNALIVNAGVKVHHWPA